MRLLTLPTYLACLLPALLAQTTVGSNEILPVLSTLKADPDLTLFYELFASTGDGESSGPPFDERFNDPATCLNYTVFAPTNEALKLLPDSVISILKRPANYEILATVLRNHIAPGTLFPADLNTTALRQIGGFSFTFNSSGGIASNSPDSTGTYHWQGSLIKEGNSFASIPASNGIVYKIDHLIDSFVTYFSSDESASTSTLPAPTTASGTMSDVLKFTPELSNLSDVWQKLNPDFFNRLSLYTSDCDNNTVYLAPSNSAFELLGSGLERATWGSNYGASYALLAHGLGVYDQGEGQVTTADMLNITVKGSQAANAKIEQIIAAENGEVWVVSRWLDPIWGA